MARWLKRKDAKAAALRDRDSYCTEFDPMLT
jgi:hypothetical protein